MNVDTAPVRAGRREWIALAVLALPTLLVSMDFSVQYLALPHLTAALQPTGTQQLWIIDAYGFMIAGFLVTMGTLGDRIGRRRLLLIGGAAFGVASVLAAYSTSSEMLIVSRALLGVAGATLMPSTLALISNMFRHPRQHGVAISVWLSCFMSGLVLGPAVGGVMLEFFWWGSVYLIAVPVMLLLLIAAPRLLPEFRDPNAGRLDLVSVLLSLAAILPIVYGLKELARDGWRLSHIAAVILGVVVGVVFVRRQTRLSSPLLDLHTFRFPTFRASLIVLFVAGIVGTGTYLLVTQYMQNVAGLTPTEAGLWLAPPTLAMIVSTMLAPVLARRIRPGFVIAAGLLVAALGYFMLTRIDSEGGLGLVLLGFVIANAGSGLMASLGNSIVLTSTPPEKAGSAAAIVQTNNELGLGLGIALLGSVATAVYRGHISGSVPASVPPHEAELAHESISGAIAAAGDLPAPLDLAVLEPARDAYTTALNAVGWLSTLIVVVLAVFCAVALRRARLAGDLDAGDAEVAVPDTAERGVRVG